MFPDIPLDKKLALFDHLTEKQRKAMTKQRNIGKDKNGNNVKCRYVPIAFVQRALNFVFGIGRWGYSVKEHKHVPNGKKYEAMTLCEFWWIDSDGNKLTTDIFGTSQMYSNPSTDQFTVYKSAIANAKKQFAKMFNIFAEDLQKEAVAFSRVDAKAQVVDNKQRLADKINKNTVDVQDNTDTTVLDI